MKSMRFLQRHAFQQLSSTRSALLRQTLNQLQQTSSQPFRTGPPLQHTSLHRSLHTKGSAPNPFSQALRSRRAPNSNSNQSHGRRHNSSSSSSSTPPPDDANLSFSQRFKKLSREYGWGAVGVYLALTALDLPFCFLAVRMLGTDRIGHYEHVALEFVRGLVKWPLPEVAQDKLDAAGDLVSEKVSEVVGDAPVEKRILEETSAGYSKGDIEDHGYSEAEQANRGADASIWTQLGLAYVIHKSFIFVRLPLAVAITPKVVKTLRGWGWNIGKMPARKGVTSGTNSTGTGTTAGVNTKGSKVKPDD
ncbi:hypothetical protein LTR84_001670 [Exophiala bonariae]|uniref:DUF1279 domain-containing protein n=1 Tax=Exophiala bonariae TaxID=1690606 RepID=A0AAV9NDD8_9EURO|nr:hypothetical protein LTR84_001670 [Exophiala bonariae]